jgi:uncharacterized protein (TIRG00374 family)
MSSAVSAVGDSRTLRWWHVVRYVVALALAGLAFFVLNGQRNELIGASTELANLRVFWLCLGIGCEVVSFASFGMLQRRLLESGGVKVTIPQMTAMSFAAGAIADSIPAGPAFASIYAYRYYRRHGAIDAVAGWTLIATVACGAVALGLLATAGILLAVSEGANDDLIWVITVVFLLSVVADAIVFQRRWLERVAIALLAFSRRITGHPKRHGLLTVEEFLARLDAVHLTWKDLVATIAAALGNWVFDCACLACSFLAVGAPVPWRGLLLAYGAGQLAANLPITPGGLGVVEGSLTIALVAFGGAELSTVAAVLCYRIISFWGYLPVGWLSWAGIALSDRLARRGHATTRGRDQRRLGAERQNVEEMGQSAHIVTEGAQYGHMGQIEP